MFPTGQYLFGAASKYQVMRYDQEYNTISATSNYIQDILNEVLHTQKDEINSIVELNKLNSDRSIKPHLPCHELHQLCDYQ